MTSPKEEKDRPPLPEKLHVDPIMKNGTAAERDDYNMAMAINKIISYLEHHHD